MTKKLEETFNLPPMDNAFDEEIEADLPEEYEEAVISEPADLLNALTTTEKIDSALPTISGLQNHDREMDDIAKRALTSYENLAELAENSPDNYTSRMYEVASNMLRTAMDARNSKVDKKLKIIDMQLKKARLDFETQRDTGSGGASAQGAEFDRNELLQHLMDGGKSDEEDSQDK